MLLVQAVQVRRDRVIQVPRASRSQDKRVLQAVQASVQQAKLDRLGNKDWQVSQGLQVLQVQLDRVLQVQLGLRNKVQLDVPAVLEATV